MIASTVWNSVPSAKRGSLSETCIGSKGSGVNSSKHQLKISERGMAFNAASTACLVFVFVHFLYMLSQSLIPALSTMAEIAMVYKIIFFLRSLTSIIHLITLSHLVASHHVIFSHTLRRDTNCSTAPPTQGVASPRGTSFRSSQSILCKSSSQCFLCTDLLTSDETVDCDCNGAVDVYGGTEI